MISVNQSDIERNLPASPKRVESGKSFFIKLDQRYIAELRPINEKPAEDRPHGLCAGEFQLPDGFDEPWPDELLKGLEAL